MVFISDLLAPLETLKQNILLGLPDDPATLATAVQSAALEQDVQVLEAGLDTPVGTRGVKLSGVGREGGKEALRFFTEPKNVCIAK